MKLTILLIGVLTLILTGCYAGEEVIITPYEAEEFECTAVDGNVGLTGFYYNTSEMVGCCTFTETGSICIYKQTEVTK